MAMISDCIMSLIRWALLMAPSTPNAARAGWGGRGRTGRGGGGHRCSAGPVESASRPMLRDNDQCLSRANRASHPSEKDIHPMPRRDGFLNPQILATIDANTHARVHARHRLPRGVCRRLARTRARPARLCGARRDDGGGAGRPVDRAAHARHLDAGGRGAHDPLRGRGAHAQPVRSSGRGAAVARPRAGGGRVGAAARAHPGGHRGGARPTRTIRATAA